MIDESVHHERPANRQRRDHNGNNEGNSPSAQAGSPRAAGGRNAAANNGDNGRRAPGGQASRDGTLSQEGKNALKAMGIIKYSGTGFRMPP